MRTERSERSSRALITSFIVATVALSLAAVGVPAGAAAPQQQLDDNLRLQVSGLTGGPGKPSTPRIDSRLEQLAEIERRDGTAAARAFAAANAIRLDAQGRAQVVIHEILEHDWRRESSATGDDPEQRIGRANYGDEALFELLEVPISERVARLGGSVGGRSGNLIDATMPIANLHGLEDSFAVGWVEPTPLRRVGVTSEGVNLIGAATLQAAPVSYQAADVRVGVIDIGFKGYQDLLGSELPSSVTVNSFHPGGIDGDGEALLDQVHGTACAEIIHDVVPGAELFFANINGVADNSDAVDWMIEQGVDVISYSIGWYNAGPGDGRGPINDAVDRALEAGIEFVVSAGNDARNHWQGQFTDADGNGFHEFAPGDESNAVFLEAGEDFFVLLNWDDWFASAQDYDLYIVDAADNVVAASTGFQTGFQNPAESAGFTAPAAGTYHVVIDRFSATRDVNLELFFLTSREMQYIVPAGSLTIPADTDDAVAVGATFWGDDVIEFFSSQGPTADGRTKPDLVAPDGVSTVSYGNLGFSFFGTSASAPHAAGAVALMKARFGVFSLEQIREILYGRAIDKGVSGMDNIYGHGRLDLIGQ